MMNIINRFKEVHGDKYDYRNVIYTKMINKVEIICHEHGSFYQTPHSHLKGQGCPECAKVNRAKKEQIQLIILSRNQKRYMEKNTIIPR